MRDSSARRTWTSERSRDDLLVDAVEQLRAAGATFTFLFCSDLGWVTWRGTKRLDTEAGDYATVQATAQAPDGPTELTITLTISANPPDDAHPPTTRFEDPPPVPGDCPDGLVDALDLS